MSLPKCVPQQSIIAANSGQTCVTSMPGCDARAATRKPVFSNTTAKLAAQPMLSIYSVRVDTSYEDAHEHLTLSFDFDENEWSERRKDDGFVLVVGYAALPPSAQALVSIDRAKDAVEKELRTIKTDIKIRPVFHHTDRRSEHTHRRAH